MEKSKRKGISRNFDSKIRNIRNADVDGHTAFTFWGVGDHTLTNRSWIKDRQTKATATLEPETTRHNSLDRLQTRK